MNLVTDIKTDKDAFNFVVNFLTNQGEKSTGENGECKYRGFLQSTLKNVVEQCLAISSGSDETPEYELAYFNKMESLIYDAKCAVGCLISDEFYDPIIEGSDIHDESVVEMVVRSNPNWNITNQSEKLLGRLQGIHDNDLFNSWQSIFEDMSLDFNEEGEYCPNYDN